MGLVRTQIALENPRRDDLQKLSVDALVDTGWVHLCVPEHVVLQLGLESTHQREVTIADGSKKLVPYVGPLEVSFGNRTCYTGALVLGDEVLLGAVPMEDLDLIIHPADRSVRANPDSPNIPSSTVKATR